jgi:hypothetical protein
MTFLRQWLHNSLTFHMFALDRQLKCEQNGACTFLTTTTPTPPELKTKHKHEDVLGQALHPLSIKQAERDSRGKHASAWTNASGPAGRTSTSLSLSAIVPAVGQPPDRQCATTACPT